VIEGQPFFQLDWVLDHLDTLAQRIGEHLLVTVIAVVVGFVISFALALLVRRYPRLYPPILAVSERAFGFDLRQPAVGLHPNRIEIRAQSRKLRRRQCGDCCADQLLPCRERGGHRTSLEDRVQQIAHAIGNTANHARSIARKTGESARQSGRGTQ